MSSYDFALADGASSDGNLFAADVLNFGLDTTITGPTLDVTATTNYQPDTISDVTAITFEATANSTATFSSAQFGATGIEAGTTITGDAHADTISVNVAAGKTFSGSGLQFSDWSASDRFDINASGDHVTVTGTSANDIINMGAFFDTTDSINGGGGSNTLKLDGNYGSAYVEITSSMLSNVGVIDLGAGFNYEIDPQSSFVAPSDKMTINASSVGASNTVSLDIANDTTDSYTVNLGAASNFVYFSDTTTIINCGPGTDELDAYGTMAAGDRIVGAGNTLLSLYGDYSAGYTFGAHELSDIDAIYLNGNYSYKLTFNNANVNPGQTLVVNGTGLSNSSYSMIVNGSHVSNGGFDLFGGPGFDELSGGTGEENSFVFNSNDLFTGADRITGGAGVMNYLDLTGNYSTALKFQNPTIQGVQEIELGTGFNYDLQLASGNVASGQTLTVDGQFLTSGESLTVNGSSISAGTLVIDGGAGLDVLNGGQKLTNFDFTASDPLTAADRITGGSAAGAENVVVLSGNYSAGLTFQNATIKDIQQISLDGDNSYNLTFASGNVASGQSLIVYSNLEGSDTMTLNASHLVGGSTFEAEMNVGTNIVTGGAGTNTFYHLNPGADTMTAGTGTNVFEFNEVSESTSTGYNTIVDFNPSNCTFKLESSLHVPGAINAAVTTGSLSTATFDSDLATAINSSHLGAFDAVLFTPNAGTLAGDTFLIIDENGTAGYQAGNDIVIELSHASNLSALATSNFET